MQLEKSLLINGKKLALASDMVRLHLSEVGEGVFEVLEQPAQASRSLVELYVGVGGKEEYLVFTGALREVKRMGEGRYRVDARELSVVMETHIIINMMRCSAREVIAKIERETGLKFLLPKGAPYLDEKLIRFNYYGKASDALQALSSKWELKEMVWCQLPDGRMYWGHWAQGPYTAAPVPIAENLISHRNSGTKTLVMPYIPGLRPGMLVEADFRFRIDGLIFSGETVKVHWKAV